MNFSKTNWLELKQKQIKKRLKRLFSDHRVFKQSTLKQWNFIWNFTDTSLSACLYAIYEIGKYNRTLILIWQL